MSTPSTSEPQTPKRFSSGTLLVAVTILVGLSVAVFGVYKIRGFKRRPVSFEKVKLAKLTTTGRTVAAAISPSGRDFAYVTADAGKQTLWLRQVSTSSKDVEIVAASEGDYQGLSFSPDGNSIYYIRSLNGEPNTVFRVSAFGGSPIRLIRDVDSPVSLSPDGRQLAYMRGYPDQKETALLVASIEGTSERKVSVLKNPSGFVIQSGPAWSPDGKLIAVAATDEKTETTYPYQRVVILDVTAGDGLINPIYRRWLHVGSIAWLRDSNSLMVTATDQESAGTQVWQVSYPSGEAKRITNDLADYQQLTASSDSRGLIAIQNERQGNLWLAPAGDESKAIQITSGNIDGSEGLSITPDGRISYTVAANGEQNLWMIDADGKNPRQLTSTHGINRTPVVSPDGKFVVFSSDRSGAMHLWRIDIDGSNPVELTHGVGDAYPQITPDGKLIIYRSYKGGNPNLFRISINGGEPVALTDRIVGPPVVSTDGKFIACSYREVGLSTPQLVVISIDGGEPLKRFDLSPPPTSYHWTSDGKALTYVRTIDGTSNLWRQPIDGGPSQQLTHFTSDLIFSTAWSREGKWLVYLKGKRTRDAILLLGT